MTKARALMTAILLTTACTTTFTVTASATTMSWFVNGVRLNGTEALASTAKVDSAIMLGLPGLGFRMNCTALSVDHGLARAGESIEAEKLRLENCSEIEPANCKLTTPEVYTEPILGLQVLALFPGSKAESVFTLLHPKKTNGVFGIINFTGPECVLSGEKPLKGSVKMLNPTALAEGTAQAREAIGSFENNSLEVAGNKTYIEAGRALLSLASGSQWSFHE